MVETVVLKGGLGKTLVAMHEFHKLHGISTLTLAKGGAIRMAATTSDGVSLIRKQRRSSQANSYPDEINNSSILDLGYSPTREQAMAHSRRSVRFLRFANNGLAPEQASSRTNCTKSGHGQIGDFQTHRIIFPYYLWRLGLCCDESAFARDMNSLSSHGDQALDGRIWTQLLREVFDAAFYGAIKRSLHRR